MDLKSGIGNHQSEEEKEISMDLRRGPWTVEEDFALINYIARHGEGRWNALAKSAGLKRTGKSCRLRWLNYLRPDVRRGNITLEEQLLILELHSRWGNRWSKIAQYLPGRTDNEIKNYWRTRVQKHAKQLKCDVNSKQFKDAMRYLWMPRLVERIQAAAAAAAGSSSTTTTSTAAVANTNTNTNTYHLINDNQNVKVEIGPGQVVMPQAANIGVAQLNSSYAQESCSTAASSDSIGTQVSPVSDLTDCYNYPLNQTHDHQDYYYHQQANAINNQIGFGDCLTSPSGYFNQELDRHFQLMDQSNQWMDGGMSDNLWNVEDYWYSQQQQQQHHLNNHHLL